MRTHARRRAALAAATAAACAMVAAAVQLPDRSGRAPQHEDRTQPVAAAAPSAGAAQCTDPEASLRPSTVDGPAVQRIKARGWLNAGVDQNSYHWGYRDPATGELSGFDIDLVHAIAKDLLGDPGKVAFIAVTTSQRIPALQQGKVDIIARTMTINCERAGQVAFSTAYFGTGQQLLKPKNSPISGFDNSLAGRRVCAAKGSTAETELKKNPHAASVLTVPNQLDCLVRLQLGQADAVLTDGALAAGQAAQDPSVGLVGKPFTTESYGVAMNLKDEDLVRRVNAVLEEFRRGGGDSPWMQAYHKWLAADLKGITAPPEPKYRD
ncbi:glutamate ABC transporter substrate-binding protein [Streptomyces sp. NPDC001262]|uniref:glutamate ABC transporter substrate-binding protein n=1 Tax=unclassified Streptomyces TaxID=2593676 RepID=UPI003688955D